MKNKTGLQITTNDAAETKIIGGAALESPDSGSQGEAADDTKKTKGGSKPC